jgi:hypothetical protein
MICPQCRAGTVRWRIERQGLSGFRPDRTMHWTCRSCDHRWEELIPEIPRPRVYRSATEIDLEDDTG